jgi:predicted amidohydrolase YtcJ
MCGLQAATANLLPSPDGEGDDIPAIQRLLRAWGAANPMIVQRYGMIMGFGYDESQLKEQRPPSRDDLDAVSAELPVLIIHTSGHLAVLNSKALAIAGITAAEEDPVGGTIFRRPGSREPSGLLSETAMIGAVGKLIARLDRDAWLAMVKSGCEAYASYGYTTCTEGRAMPALVPLFGEAAARGLLPIDTLVYPDFELGAAMVAGPAYGPTYRNRFRIGGGKLTFDGSPQGKTAWLSQPYFVPPPGQTPDFRGQPTLTPEAAYALVEKAYASNTHLLVHCNGDAASDLLIATVKSAIAKHGGSDRRTVLVHGQVLREDQVDAIRALNIIPSLFPMHTYYWGDWHRDSVLGPERVEDISPTGWCLRRGMIFSSHHDAPVAKPDSMRVLSATVTRRSRSGDIIGPRHRVSPWVALKAMTLWPAHHYFEDAAKGSLEVGKLADFAVLSDNPLTVPEDRLAGLKVTETIKEGATVYRA